MATYNIGKGRYTLPDGLSQDVLEQTIEEIHATHEATRQTDIGMGLDTLQQNIGAGIETVGNLTGLESVEQFGANQYNRNKQSLEEGRHVPDYPGSFSDQEGIGNKLGWLGEGITTQGPNSAVSLVGAGATAVAGLYSLPLAAVIGGGTAAVNYLQSTGEVANEMRDKTGSYNPKIAALGGAVIAALDKFGAGKVFPKDKLLEMSGEQVIQELMKKGYTEAANEVAKKFAIEGGLEGVQEGISMAAAASQGGEYTAGEVADRALDSFVLGGTMSAGTHATAEVLSRTVGQSPEAKLDTADQYLRQQLADPSVTEPRNPQAEGSRNKLLQQLKVVEAAQEGDAEALEEAAKFIDVAAADATLAKRLDTIATTGYPDADGQTVPYKTKDVDRDSNKGVRALVDQAHKDIVGEVKELQVVLKDLLKPDTADFSNFESLMDIVLADSGISLSKNKAKSMLSTQNFEAVDRLVGHTEEGQRLLNLMRESNALTDVHLNDYVGGISKYTDQFSPFGVHTGYDSGKSVANVARMAGSAALAANTAGASTAIQGGIAGAGRMLGRGSRSTVDNYIRNNAGGQPMGQQSRPDVPSVMQQANAAKVETDRQKAAELAQKEAEAQQATVRQQQLEQTNRVLGQRQAPPTDESPQWTMETATGLDKQGVATALRMLERLPTFADQPAIRQAVEGYRKTVDTGGRVPNLSPLIRAANMVANENPEFIQRIAEPNQQVEQQQAQVDKTESQKQTEGYQRGIEANLKFGSDLMDAMNADKSIEPVVKAKLGNALKQIQLNLSEDPVGTLSGLAKGLAEDGVPGNLIEQYLGPYAERVARQQKKPVPPPSDMSVADRPNSDSRLQKAEEQGFDTSTVYYHGTASDIEGFDGGFKGSATGARSAKKAFWFSDSEGTARSYANFAATSQPVANLVEQANKAEADGDFDGYDRLLGEAEALEQQLNDERRNGQNIIPVYLPKDLLVIDMKGRSYDDFGVSDEVSFALDGAKKDGRKGVKFLNLNDAIGRANLPATHIAIINSKDIRSVNAQFDPNKKDSSLILADRTDTPAPALTIPSNQDTVDLEIVVPTDLPPVSKAHQKKAISLLQGPAFNIGKEGDALEHGIQDQYQLMLLSRTFNTKVEFVSNQQELDLVLSEEGYAPDDYSREWSGQYYPHQKYSTLYQEYIREPGGFVIIKDLPANIALRTAVHEVSHGVTLYTEAGLPDLKIENPINQRKTSEGEYELSVTGSFQGYFFDHIMGLPSKERKKVIDELMYVQREMSFATKPMRDADMSEPFRMTSMDGLLFKAPYNETKRKVVNQYKMYISAQASARGEEITQRQIDDYANQRWDAHGKEYEEGYLSDHAESIVDAFMLALSDPKKAKEVTPKFYKMAKGFFNNSGGPLKFFSALLALMFAIDDGEEEEQRNQMAQGALSPQGQGALASA